MGTSSLDVVLVNPGDRRGVFQSLGSELAAIEPPVWAGLIAKFLQIHGVSVRVIDANAQDLEPDTAAERIKDMNPSLVVIVVYGHQPSASTQNMPATRAVCQSLDNLAHELPVMLLGGHVSALPERTLREEVCDFVCEGEGLYTILSLIEVLKSSTTDSLSEVPGLWYRQNGDICSNAPAPLIRDMDSHLPGVAWDSLTMDKYRAHNWHCFGESSRTPYASIYTGLGCPFTCNFCCINAPFGGSGYRCRSPENVIEEIDVLVQKYGVRNIKFADELFVLKKGHVGGICDLISDRGYDLNIWAYARVDTVDDVELLQKLRRAGVTWIALGIESGNERVLEDANKRTSRDRIFQAVAKVRDADINIIANYIFGLPEDDPASMQETFDLATELNCDFSNFYSAMAYPGSKLYDDAIVNKWLLPEDWNGYSQHAYETLPLPTKYLSGSEVLKFRDKCFVEYFSNPAYQAIIQEKFGDEAVHSIRQMLSCKLERKYA